jgi:HK97 gp10 family phage protein
MAVRTSQVTGLKEINKVLQQLPDTIERRVLQNAVNAGGRVILNAVKEKAPRHEGKQSAASKRYGTLVRNLRIQALTRVRRGMRGVRVWTKDAFWAVFYELGTKRQPARPFMEPAFQEAQDWAVQAVKDKLVEGIEKEATKLAGPYANAKKSLGVR